MKKLSHVAFSMLALCLAVGWLVVATNYEESAAVGTFRFAHAGVRCTLTLQADHTFQQTLSADSSERRASGTWHKVGEGGISFSNAFLPFAGDVPSPDGSSFADMRRTMGLRMTLEFRQYNVVWFQKHVPSVRGELTGKYFGDNSGISTELDLRENHTFAQTFISDRANSKAEGVWRLEGENVIFSKEFLTSSGEPLALHESAIAGSGTDIRHGILQIEVKNNSSFRTALQKSWL